MNFKKGKGSFEFNCRLIKYQQSLQFIHNAIDRLSSSGFSIIYRLKPPGRLEPCSYCNAFDLFVVIAMIIFIRITGSYKF